VTNHNEQINLAGVLCNHNVQQAVMCIELKKKELKTGQLWLGHIHLIRIRRLLYFWTWDFCGFKLQRIGSLPSRWK